MQDAPLSPDRPQAQALDLDDLMARVRAEVEARKRQALMDATQSADGVVNSEPRTAAALLILPEADFVRESYIAIFGREPEEGELTALRDQLLTGRITRVRALKDLLKTEEARTRKSRIKGLSRSLVYDRYRRSLLGRWLAQMGHTLRVVYLLPYRIRQFLKRVDAIERMGTETALRTDALEQRLARVEEATDRSRVK